MKKMMKIIMLIVILSIISVFLYMTGKRHDVYINNNTASVVKYSINGANYKILEMEKKVKVFSKGYNNVIFIKTVDNKVIEKELPSKDININIENTISGNSNWYEVIK